MSLRELRRRGRHTLRFGNALLGGLLVWVMLGSTQTTAAYLSATLADASNVVATAKQFTISDVAAVAKPGGSVLISWSAASWAAGGYSVRRSTSPAGPFSEIVAVGAGTSSYSDTTGVDGTAYSYKVFGLSGAGGMGTGSSGVTATADATSPTVASTLPATAATNVPLNTSTTINFSEAMNTILAGASMDLADCGASATCASGTTSLSGAQSWPTSSSLLFTPTAPLSASHWYGIRLTTAATDVSGNVLSCAGASAQSLPNCYWTFQTGSSAGAPGLAASAPRAGATAVPTNTSLTFLWTAALNPTGRSAAAAGFSLQQVSGPGSGCYVFSGSGQLPACTLHGGTWSDPYADGSQLSLANPLLAGTSYTAVESASDLTNLVVNSTATWITALAGDSTPPSVLRVVPAGATTGISPSTSVTVTFSEAMDLGTTSHAFSLRPWAVGASCSGGLGAVIAGTITWHSAAELVFHPSADLSAASCYQVDIANTATDVSLNALGAYAGTNFTVFGGTLPTATLTNGAYYYPGATITASGSGWGTGTGNVVPTWDNGIALDAAGSPVVAGNFSGYTFSLPSTASSGGHTISFVRATGATVGVELTVQSPSSISLTASRTDISAGGSSAITATVYDQGQPAANAVVALAITTDAGGRGSFISIGSGVFSTSSLTNGSGQPATVMLYVSGGLSFTPITITATSGSASRTITIIDPAPLPPENVRMTATDQLDIAWLASPSSMVTQYQISLGTVSGRYDHVISAGARTSYTETAVVVGQTYYAVVRAADAHGALSDASPEIHITMPALIPLTLVLAGSNPPIGIETTTLVATIANQYGHALTGALVAFSAPTGVKLEPVSAATGADGTVAIKVTRTDSQLTSALVHATSGGSTRADLLVLFTAPTPTATATSSPSPTSTVAATRVPLVTSTPMATGTPLATGTSLALPTATAAPSPRPLESPTAVATIDSTPTPTSTALAIPSATPPSVGTPTAGPALTATSTPVVSASSTPTSTPVSSSPTATPASPMSTATPVPAVSTATPLPSTSTPAPTNTPTQVPTRTPIPSSPTPTH